MVILMILILIILKMLVLMMMIAGQKFDSCAKVLRRDCDLLNMIRWAKIRFVKLL